MIGTIFEFGNEIIEVRVNNNDVLFRTQTSGGFATIEQLNLSEQGAIKEFPDLEGNPEWKKITIKRFKEKIKSLSTEIQKSNYIIKDLTKHGYKPLYRQRQGFRVEKL